MSKRNKKFRSNRSALKLEALEQRQLLATIVSGGDASNEKMSNVSVLDSAGNTNVFDQVVLTGSSIAVKADGSQVVRVDWLDADGDIVRAEFSGSGTMAINLAGASTSAKLADKYTTTNTYMQGLATITITGSAADTNLQLYSLGKGTAFNGAANPLFSDGTKLGGSHQMDMAAVVVIADNATVGNAFNSIRAANVLFSASEGVVGLAANDINFRGVITIGDIDAKGTATPVLKVGTYSDVKTVTVAGGDLKQTNSAGIQGTNITKLTVQNNVNSNGDALETQVLGALPSGVAASSVTYSSGLGAIEIDGATVTQATLDTYKTKFLGDVTIKNGLASGLVFRALQFGNIKVEGNLAGLITTDVDDANDADAAEQSIGNVTVTGDVVQGGGIESSQSIGTIDVDGKVVTTAKFGNGADNNILAQGVFTTIGKTSGDSSIGAITIDGAVSLGTTTTATAEHFVYAGLAYLPANIIKKANVGAISIGGDAKAYLTGAANTFVTARGETASIAGIAITGDAVLVNDTAAATLISTGAAGANIKNNIGDISAKSLTLGKAALAGTAISANDALGKITTNTGDLVINASANITAGGNIGDIKSAGATTVNAAIASTAGSIGNILSAGNFASAAAGTITGNKGVGDITVTKGTFNNAGTITATTGNVGKLTFSEGAATIGATITAAAGSVGDITVSKGALNVNALVSAKNIGNISVAMKDATAKAGDLTFTGTGGFLAQKAAGDWTGSSIGNVTVSNGAIVGLDNTIEFQANKIGDVSVTNSDGAGSTTNLLTDVIFSAKGVDKDQIATAAIGSITLDNSKQSGAAAAIAGGAAAVDANSGTGFSSSGNIGDVSIKAHSASELLADQATANLVIRAGNSEMMADEITTAGGAATAANNAAVKIGTVTINATMASGYNNTAATGVAGQGLFVLSGVNLAGAGLVTAPIADGAAVIAIPATAFGTSALTAGAIGAVTINDLGGSITRSSFAGANLTDAGNTTGLVNTSAIIGDTIASIKVNTGVELVNVTPTGLALTGVLGSAQLVATSPQVIDGADANRLLVVVL